ncbi:hypothetical protein AGMMS49942_15690 [Spirochaetia bacterium]|nr:hypothetical protein AGMMS49942_15690 [Spirochaetia bacterium]
MTDEERTQRVAVVKRFRELLQAQRDRFREYLTVLDKQQSVIQGGDTEALLAHVELEEHIVRDIFNIQKVILPLEGLYHTLRSDEETISLKASLEALKREATARSERNRELLSGRMAEIRQEIKSLRGNPYAARRSIYADTGSPSLLDVKG